MKKQSQLTKIILELLPYLVCIILTIAVIIFVLMQLSAASYLVLLVCINVIVLWIWAKSNRHNAKVNFLTYNSTSEFYDRLADIEEDIQELKKRQKKH